MITLDVLDTYIVLSKVVLVVVIYDFIKIIESNIFSRLSTTFLSRFLGKIINGTYFGPVVAILSSCLFLLELEQFGENVELS